MAKTIHDLAVAYGREHQGTVDIEVFEAGANAVIEEIRQFTFDEIQMKNITATSVALGRLSHFYKRLKGME